MLNKKIFILFAISLFILPLIFNLVKADIEERFEQAGETAENIGEGIEKAESNWDYFSNEWKNILLENKFVSAIDGFFTKISIVFRILFGQPYTFSLTLLGIIILWIIIFLILRNIINASGFLKGIPAYLISLAFAIILAQVQILRKIMKFLGKLAFSIESTWARFIIILSIVLIIIFLIFLAEILSKYLRGKAKRRKQEKAEKKQKKFEKFAESFEKGADI